MSTRNLLKPIVLALHRFATSRTIDHATTTPVVTRIQPTQGWGSLNLHELWEYRDLIYFLLWREVKGRYRQMALGPLWIVLQPLMMVLINTLIFGMIARLPSEDLPYPVFNYAGVLPWAFFASAVSRATNSLVAEQHLISKVYFPRLVIPVVGVLAGLVDLLAGFGVLLFIMLCFGIVPKLSIVCIPGFLLLEVATALGIGLWLAALTVQFRDVGFGVNYLLQFWMYTTPIVYAVSTRALPVSLLPEPHDDRCAGISLGTARCGSTAVAASPSCHRSGSVPLVDGCLPVPAYRADDRGYCLMPDHQVSRDDPPNSTCPRLVQCQSLLFKTYV